MHLKLQSIILDGHKEVVWCYFYWLDLCEIAIKRGATVTKTGKTKKVYVLMMVGSPIIGH